MATRTQEVLNADAMKLAIYTGGQTYVGVRLAGTWAGTVYFEGSVDGFNWIALSMTPFASGTDVSSATANGNWFALVQNYVAVRARFSRTSGSVQVYLATSEDASYQEAFLTPATIYVNSEGTAKNTLTQAAQTNRAWKLTDLQVSTAGPSWAGGQATVTIYDGAESGGTVLDRQFLEANAGSVGSRYTIDLPEEGIVGTPGNAMTIVFNVPGANVTSNINAKFTAA